MTEPVPQNTEQNPANVSAPSTIPDSHWTKGDISFRKGNCNVLLIAPHGYEKDDEKTYDITRLAADQLGCYAFVTEAYQKPPKIRDPKTKKIIIGSNGKPIRHQPDESKKWINLNRKDQVHEFLENEFKEPLLNTVNEIIKKFGKALILWIHGIDDDNLTPDNTEGNLPGMDALIGVGQGNPDLTAKMETVEKLIAALQSNSDKPIKAALAEKDSDYCGRHENIMNQYFRFKEYGLDKVESIQIEIRKKGFREEDNFKITSMALANSLDSAVQSGAIKKIKIKEIDLSDGQFMSRIDNIDADSVEFKRLVESVEKDGVLINFIVRKRTGKDGKPYQLISGFRRMAALKASKNGKYGFEDQTVWARVLDAAVSDEEAYRVSFTENLIRKELSLWEIAQACAGIKKRMVESGKEKGEIDNNIANILHKDNRTVRRYLKLASINDPDIVKAVRNGSINYLDALVIGEKDFKEGDIAVLLGHLKIYPKPTREFKQFYDNLEHCCELSGLSMASILEFKNADAFLSLEMENLKDRIEHLHKITGRDYQDILKGKAGPLVKETGEIDAGLKKKEAIAEFQKKNKDKIDRVSEAFCNANINGNFKIKPILSSNENQVEVTITAPETEIWQVFDAVSKANKAQSEKDIQKENSEALPSKDVSSASNSNGRPQANLIDETKAAYKGKFTR